MVEEDASRIVAGVPAPQKVSTSTMESASKSLLVDVNGVDLESMQEMIKKQAQMIQDLSMVIKQRDSEDAEITRQLIVSKTKKWNKPFTYDELQDFEKDELDDLQKFVGRVGRVDLSAEIDEAPRTTLAKAARRFPKLSKDSEPYDVNAHTFSLGKKQ